MSQTKTFKSQNIKFNQITRQLHSAYCDYDAFETFHWIQIQKSSDFDGCIGPMDI